MIRVQGEEAAKFLQGQLTQDFVLLGTAEARLAAFCTAKGRMQASFIGFKLSPGDSMSATSFFQVEPVPEPSSIALAVIGGGGVMWLAVRRRRRR